MIQPLRQLHRRLFLGLAILLPVFYWAGIHARHRAPLGFSRTRIAHPSVSNTPAAARLLP